METLINWVLLLLLFFIFGLAHELGHAAMSRIFFKDKGWIITMGSGPAIIRTKRLVVNLWFFVEGKINYSVVDGKTSHQILRSAGGFIVNIVFAALIFLFSIKYSEADVLPFWWRIVPLALFANIVIVVVTMLPMKYFFGVVKGMPSDGLQILRLIKNRKKDTGT